MRCTALTLTLALFPALLWADTFPSQERGFQAEKAFQIGDFDSINGFNGGLILTLPIAGSYNVGGSLSYGLTLIYNSNVWDFEATASGLKRAMPVRRASAGLGWRLSLGELLDKADPENDNGVWTYIGGDGAEHTFYDKLHEGEPVTSGVFYTRDNSYLRLRFVGAQRFVDFPGGTMYTFTEKEPLDWNLTRMEDRFGNWANVTYTHDQDSGQLKWWKIQDLHGRTQTVNFIPASWYGVAVGSVVLTGFNGQSATYTFNYTPVTIPFPCPDDDPETMLVTVPLLTEVKLPDGSALSMPTSDYHLDQSVNCRLPGVLKAITTRLLGRTEWGYGGYVFPIEPQEKTWRSSSQGVTSRTLKNSAGVIQGTWTYTPALNPPPGPFTVPREAIRTIKTPLGDKTESFFSVALDESEGWTQLEYGLPLSRFESDGAGRFLSTRAWDCDGFGANCVLKRSTYVTYERDTAFIGRLSAQHGSQPPRCGFTDDLPRRRRPL